MIRIQPGIRDSVVHGAQAGCLQIANHGHLDGGGAAGKQGQPVCRGMTRKIDEDVYPGVPDHALG